MVRDVSVVDGDVVVDTDGEPVIFRLDKLKDMVDEFLPIEDKGETQSNSAAMQVFQADGGTMTDLTQVFMDNIKKVQKDPAYIEQAKTINGSVKEIINITRLKVDMIREVRKHK